MSRSTVSLTPYRRADGIWYVEILRPGIVSEHVGDFSSRATAEQWIRDNEPAYIRARSRHRDCELED